MDTGGPRRPGPDGYDPFWDELDPHGGLSRRGGYMHYGPDGQPCSLRQWSEWHGDPQIKIVAQDELRWARRRGVWVSTVYLGINHQFGDGPPLIYETMAFRRATTEGLDCERWATREQAGAGHEQIVAALTREQVSAGHTVVRTQLITPDTAWRAGMSRRLRALAAELGPPGVLPEGWQA